MFALTTRNAAIEVGPASYQLQTKANVADSAGSQWLLPRRIFKRWLPPLLACVVGYAFSVPVAAQGDAPSISVGTTSEYFLNSAFAECALLNCEKHPAGTPLVIGELASCIDTMPIGYDLNRNVWMNLPFRTIAFWGFRQTCDRPVSIEAHANGVWHPIARSDRSNETIIAEATCFGANSDDTRCQSMRTEIQAFRACSRYSGADCNWNPDMRHTVTIQISGRGSAGGFYNIGYCPNGVCEPFIDCHSFAGTATCQANLPEGVEITLSAVGHIPGGSLDPSGGACTWANEIEDSPVAMATCVFVLDGNKLVTARFSDSPRQDRSLTVSKAGSGTGVIASSPAGIDCGNMCSALFANGESVQLTATPSAGSRFERWEGACSGSSSTCTVTMNTDRSVTANFVPAGGGGISHRLNLTRYGSGTVTSSPGGITCGSICQGTFAQNAQVTLTATPAPGWRFHKWGGGCTGSEGAVCRITISQERNATVYFQEQDGAPRSASLFFDRVDGPSALTIVRNAGTAVTLAWRTANLPGNTTCEIRRVPGHDYNRSVSPVATGSVTDHTIHTWPARNWLLYLWCSDGTTSPDISLAITPPSAGETATLSLTRTGSGTVTSAPGGIACGNTCQGTFALGTQVVLTATPAAGWRFKRWGGGCSGSTGNVCRIQISQNRSATVYFEPVSNVTATLSLVRSGAGTVISTAGGIACGGTCQGTFTRGTQVTLTATPAPGWRFHKWGGGCTGVAVDNVCSITISQNRNATVYFQEEDGLPRSSSLFFNNVDGPSYLSVARGSGTPVTFAWRTENLPAGTTCRVQRLPNHDYKKNVSPITGGTLTDTAIHTWATGDRKFYLWCSDGTNSPEITLNIAPPATTHTLTVQTTGTGAGTIVSAPAGIDCGATCSASFVSDSTVTLTATANGADSIFTGWTGACSGTAPTCAMTMNSTKTVGAVFADLNSSGGVQAVSAGAGHTCALTVGGAVLCWGSNGFGQLGDGTTTRRLTPVAVVGLSSGVRAISAGYSYTCALTDGGAVHCWGRNVNGQIGDGTTTNRLTPVAVSGLSSGVQAIAAGNEHVCALTSEGAVRCWGINLFGGLGDGTTMDRYTPVPVSGLSSGVQAISAGSTGSCALTIDGAALCWGPIPGNGTLYRHTPVAVSGLSSGVQAISGGGSNTCALTSGGAMWCWGENNYGQLGDGTSGTSRLTPVAVSGLSSGVQAISSGGGRTCALTSGRTMWCWGSSDSVLGADRLLPEQIAGLNGGNGVLKISVGGQHTCASTDNGSVWCWGSNGGGQIGDGTTVHRPTPVQVIGL